MILHQKQPFKEKTSAAEEAGGAARLMEEKSSHKKSLEPQAFRAAGHVLPTMTPESSKAVEQGEKTAHSMIPEA